MEHDSGLFGIHKSVWQDWPCILRTVRVGVLNTTPQLAEETMARKKHLRGTTKETKKISLLLEVEIFNHVLMIRQWGLVLSWVVLCCIYGCALMKPN